MARRAIAFDGSLTTDLNKAVVDFLKLNFKITEGEVFDIEGYGADYLNLNSDDSIHAVVDKTNKKLVSGNLVATNIVRDIPGEVTVELEGDDLRLSL